MSDVKRLRKKIQHKKPFDDLGVVRLNLDGDSQLRVQVELLREDLKDVTNRRKSGNAATIRYAIKKAFGALESEENLYEDVKKTKSRHVP